MQRSGFEREENSKKRRIICTESPTYLRQREEKKLNILSEQDSPFSARFQPHFKPSGSPAVHFWVLQARCCSGQRGGKTPLRLIFNPFSSSSFHPICLRADAADVRVCAASLIKMSA
ncbi:hypothetical protein CRENBAI_004658 [Crenichthys baileyi]|uniref:Uncharacterized protein n=1 Tax=Crenichthys baileyi TaxID=28760 RepID=A0AAV9RN13_9TELE